MRIRSLLQIVAIMIGAWLITPAIAASRPQDTQSTSQGDSVAEAARRSREKKKNAASKPAKVIDDDDLAKRNYPAGNAGLNVGAPPQEETAPPSAAAVAEAEADDKVATAEAKKRAADDDAKIADLKAQLAEAEKDLDISQREFALDQDAFLSKTDYANDTVGKAKLDAEKAQIASQQQDVERLKTKLAALEELKKQRGAARSTVAPNNSENPAGAPPQN
jgi:hypothetical protein